jgi:indolepyruvate ferredoxin oxidoreductase alpha subunit
MALCHEPYAVASWAYGLGSAIGVAAGLARAGEPALAVVGDFGFVHSGLQALMEAVHLRLTLHVVIVNDFQSRRTGGQAHSVTPGQPGRHALSIRRLLDGCDVPAVEALTVRRGASPADVLLCLERSAARPGVSVALLDLET